MPDMEVHSLCKQQQRIFSVGEAGIPLPACQLLIDATKAAIHCFHGTAESFQPPVL